MILDFGYGYTTQEQETIRLEVRCLYSPPTYPSTEGSISIVEIKLDGLPFEPPVPVVLAILKKAKQARDDEIADLLRRPVLSIGGES